MCCCLIVCKPHQCPCTHSSAFAAPDTRQDMTGFCNTGCSCIQQQHSSQDTPQAKQDALRKRQHWNQPTHHFAHKLSTAWQGAARFCSCAPHCIKQCCNNNRLSRNCPAPTDAVLGAASVTSQSRARISVPENNNQPRQVCCCFLTFLHNKTRLLRRSHAQPQSAWCITPD